MAALAQTQVLQLFRKGGLKIGAKTEVIILKIVRHFALRLFKKAPWYSFPLLRHPSLVTSPGFMVEDMAVLDVSNNILFHNTKSIT